MAPGIQPAEYFSNSRCCVDQWMRENHNDHTACRMVHHIESHTDLPLEHNLLDRRTRDWRQNTWIHPRRCNDCGVCIDLLLEHNWRDHRTQELEYKLSFDLPENSYERSDLREAGKYFFEVI